ncbi:hypothetical protein B0A48_18539 [Cryoendolithus antarcticus]|uniref:Uncharacterized protein n=1 Tax=Cryoendolithus antarcticus TaxID=1507870 RepID=A0A1V8S8S5_9PEZI|nr:hypothetical protein B0A48_18539 [Cryoendolithus antarcticus]
MDNPSAFRMTSGVCKVTSWLDDLTPPPYSSRKRRRPLVEMDSNTTPRKKNTHPIDSTPKAFLVSTEISIADAEDITPRPAVVALTSATTLRPDDSPSHAGHPTMTSTTDSSTDASSTARKRKRDGSPVKSLTMLKRAEYFVEQRSIGRAKDLPEKLQSLAKAMKDIGCARGIIPSELAADLVSDLAEDEDDATPTSCGW